MTRFRHVVIVLSLTLGSAFLISRKISRVGLNVDDATAGFLALHAPADDPFVISPFGRPIPLAYNDYSGPWSIYALRPFVAVIPDRIWAIRTFTLTWAAACPALVYALAFLLTDSAPLAVLGGLATATWPYLNYQAKGGFSDSGVVGIALCLAGLLSLILAARRRSATAWHLSCAAIGLSVGFATHGLAFLAAWGLSALWLRRELRPAWGSKTAFYGGSALSLSIGMGPLILGNVLLRWFTLRYVVAHLRTPRAGIDNLLYIHNMVKRLGALMYHFDDSPIWLGLLGLSIAAYALELRRAGRLKADGKIRLLPGLFFAVILSLSPFTLGGLGGYHIAVLFPLGLLMMLSASKYSWSGGFPGLNILLGAALAIGTLANAVHVGRSWDRIEMSGASNYAKTDEAARWLMERRAANVFLMDKDLSPDSFRYATDGAITPRGEYYNGPGSSGPSPDGPGQLDEMIRAKSGAYIVGDYTPGTQPESLALLEPLCVKYSKSLNVAADFPNTLGLRGIRIYEVVDGRRR